MSRIGSIFADISRSEPEIIRDSDNIPSESCLTIFRSRPADLLPDEVSYVDELSLRGVIG